MYQLLDRLADRKRQQLDSNGAVALQQARAVGFERSLDV